jgi:hypothetical protein
LPHTTQVDGAAEAPAVVPAAVAVIAPAVVPGVADTVPIAVVPAVVPIAVAPAAVPDTAGAVPVAVAPTAVAAVVPAAEPASAPSPLLAAGAVVNQAADPRPESAVHTHDRTVVPAAVSAATGISAFTVEQVYTWATQVVGISTASADKLRGQEVNGRALLRLTVEKLTSGAYQLPAGAAENVMEEVERCRGSA